MSPAADARRQTPSPAALVISSGLAPDSKPTGLESGLHEVAEVVVGCLIGIGVSWLMTTLWPRREGHSSV